MYINVYLGTQYKLFFILLTDVSNYFLVDICLWWGQKKQGFQDAVELEILEL